MSSDSKPPPNPELLSDALELVDDAMDDLLPPICNVHPYVLLVNTAEEAKKAAIKEIHMHINRAQADRKELKEYIAKLKLLVPIIEKLTATECADSYQENGY